MKKRAVAVGLLFLLASCLLFAPGVSGQEGSLDEAYDLLDLAHRMTLAGRNREAFEHFQRALPTFEERGHTIYSLSLSAVISANLGRYEECVSLAREGIQLAREQKDPEAEAVSRNNLGLGYRFLGNNKEALAEYRKALAIHRELGNVEFQAQTLINVGWILFVMGRYKDAVDRYEEAKGLARDHASSSWGINQSRIADINLAAIYEKIGDPRAAAEIYRGLLEDDQLPVDQRAHLLSNLGRVYCDLGAPSRGLRYFESAAKAFRDVGEPGSVSNLYLATGKALCENLEDHDRGQDRFRKALDLSSRIEDRAEQIFDLGYLARCLVHTGNLEEAEARASEAIDLARSTGYREGLWLALKVRATARSRMGREHEALADCRECLDELEEVREGGLEREDRAGFLADKQDVYALAVRLALKGSDGSEPTEETIRDAFDIAERRRARSLLDEFGGEVSALGEVQAGLAPRTEALVEFLLGRSGSTVFVVTSGEARAVLLEDTGEMDRLVDRVRSGMRSGEGLDPVAWPALFRLLVGPLLEAIPSGVTDLILVADGALSFLPFAGLKTGLDDDAPFVLELYAVSHAPSASTLLALRNRARLQEPDRELVAFGVQTLPRPGSLEEIEPSSFLMRLVSRFGLDPLEYTVDEVDRIAKRIPGPHELRTGEGASVTAFLRLAPDGARIVHFATHSVVNPDAPDGSAILLTPDGDTDGLLRRSDLHELSLETELVTLSTCESARGKQVRGEGVLGFARSFLRTGSRSVLCTLWPVMDRHSPEMMEQFYHHVGLGLSPRQALRQAQLAFLDHPRGADPRLWAPYVLVGDGASPLYPEPPRPPVAWLAILIGAMSALLVWLVSERRHRRARDSIRIRSRPSGMAVPEIR